MKLESILDVDINSLPHYFFYAMVPNDYVGPVYITESRAVAWFKAGALHRIGKPAIVWPSRTDSTKPIGFAYVENNDYHRLDGPAFIQHKNITFSIHGKRFTEENFWNHPLVIKHLMKHLVELDECP